MDSYKAWPATGDERAIRFTGNWREYLPIAATNVALIIVTLGIYRFWATARQRRYLWSRTHIVDDGLEWTGTGKEMFFGFLMVVAFILPFFVFIQFLFPALVARGKEAAAGGVLPLDVPLLTTCPSCEGTGGFVFDCPRCDGEGKVERRFPVPLRIPQGVREGTVFQVAVDEPGVLSVLLTVHIRPH